MKIEENIPPKVFNPITITLETQEEAEAMWCAINWIRRSIKLCAGEDLGPTVCVHCVSPANRQELDRIGEAMYRKFNSVFSSSKLRK